MSDPGPVTSATGAGVAPAWRLSRPVVLLALLVAVLLLLPVGVGLAVGGIAAALGLAMGYTASASPAMKVPGRYALALAVPAALTGVAAAGVNGQALPAAALVALSCLLVAPASVHENGLLSGIPTVAAFFAVIPDVPDPAPVGGWMLLGSLVIVAVLARVRQPAAPDRVPEAAAWLQAAAMAVSTGVVVYLLTVHPVPHGYWIAMTLTIVLRPYGHETTRIARQRVVGTIGGSIVALGLVLLLPAPVALLASGLLFVLLIAYTVTGQYALAVACSTPFIVLLGGGSAVDDALGVAVERVLTTVVGALIAGFIALAVARQTRRLEARRPGAAVVPAATA